MFFLERDILIISEFTRISRIEQTEMRKSKSRLEKKARRVDSITSANEVDQSNVKINTKKALKDLFETRKLILLFD